MLRAIHKFDFENKSCTLPAVIPEGTKIRFMRRDQQGVLNSGRIGAAKIMADLASIAAIPKMVCQFDCAGRGKSIVGEDVYKGMEMVQAEFDGAVSWMGSFTFGEISPIEKHNYFHNFTATLAVFY